MKLLLTLLFAVLAFSVSQNLLRAQPAPWLHPAELLGAKSLNSDIPTEMSFLNLSKETLTVYWLDDMGCRKRMATLRPRGAYAPLTFVGHAWLITDAKDRAWALFYADAQARIVKIKEPLVEPVAGPPFTPTKQYQQREIEGFTVLLHPDVIKNKQADEAVKELKARLQAIIKVMPGKHLADLRKIHFFINWKNRCGAGRYHAGDEWLMNNGLNPDMANHIELSDVQSFFDAVRGEQPFMILHELAHGYHYQKLKDDHAGIADAYDKAMKANLYECVKHVDGTLKRAYAATDRFEYFAELTEAYFGKNDYFPFHRADLQKHDPVGYQLMRDVWGEPKK